MNVEKFEVSKIKHMFSPFNLYSLFDNDCQNEGKVEPVFTLTEGTNMLIIFIENMFTFSICSESLNQSISFRKTDKADHP